MSVTIRAAQFADCSAVYQLITELAEFEKITHELTGTLADLETNCFGHNPAVELLVAERDDALVGYALYFHNYSSFRARRGLYIEDIYVRPDQRGAGIGEYFLNALRDIAVARDCARMEWTVIDWNVHAIRFYERMGARVLPEWRICRLELQPLTKAA